MIDYKKYIKVIPFMISMILYVALHIFDYILPEAACDGALILLWIPILLSLAIGIFINVYDLFQFLYSKDDI